MGFQELVVGDRTVAGVEGDGEVELLGHLIERKEIPVGRQAFAFHAPHEDAAGAVFLAEFKLGADLSGIDQG